VAFQVADRHPAPAVGSADHGGEHQFHGGLLIRQPAGDLGAVAFLDEGPFGQVRRADPDAVPDWDSVDGQQRLEVLGEARDRGRVLPLVGVDEPVGGGPGGVQGGGVPHGVDVGEDFPGGLVGELGADVGQPDRTSTGSAHYSGSTR
jgi:hypothetical protein